MTKSKMLIGLMSLALSNQAFAAARAEMIKEAGGAYKIKFCDVTQGPQGWVGFQLGANGIIQKEVLGADSCVTKSYSAGLGAEGKQLTVHKMSKRPGNDDSQGVLLTTIVRNQAAASNPVQAPTPAPILFNDIQITVTTLENRNGEPYKILIKFCHPQFTFRDTVSVTNRATLGSDRLISKPSYVTADKCFTTEYLKGEIQDGDEIGIGLASIAKPIKLSLKNVPWKRSQVSTPPPTTVTPPPTVVTPPPQPGTGTGTTLPMANENEIAENARRAADVFARNLSRNLGQIENIRYNLFLGFENEKRKAARYGRDVKNLNDYRDAYASAVQSGRTSGFSAGQSLAVTRANELATADVGAAVDAIMNGQAQQLNVNKRQNLSETPFAGLDLNLPAVATVGDRLKARDRDLQNELNRRFFSRDSEIVLAEDILDGRFQVYQLYGINEYKFELLDSYFREAKAFEAFVKGYFQPRQGFLRYFNEISDATKYQNAPRNSQLFRAEFERQYDRVIIPLWNEVVKRERSEIQTVGEDLYIELTLAFAKDLGTFDGQKAGYKESSRSGFLQDIQTRYDQAVVKVTQDVSSKAVIAEVLVKAQTSDGDLEVTLGESIDLVLTNAANRGLKDGSVLISPVASNEVIVTKPAVSHPLPAVSRLRNAVVFQGLMALNRVSAPDQDIVVNFNINGSPSRSILKSKFEGLVVGLVRSNQPQIQNAILQTLVGFLKKEWEDKKAVVGNGFNNNKGDLLVERFAARAALMTAQEKAVLKNSSAAIKAAYGSRPSWSVYSADHDSAMDLLKKAGL